MNAPEIFLGSILLEPNRWKPGRPPSLTVGEWSAKAAEAGFDGWELWENHYLLAGADEQSSLRTGAPPVRVFNSYDDFGEPEENSFADLANAIRQLPAVTAVKFNIGNNVQYMDRYRASIARARASLPPEVSLWCECHPGPLLENPARRRDFVTADECWPFDIIIHPFLLGPKEIIRWGEIAGSHIKHAHLQMRDTRDARRFMALSDDPQRVCECMAALVQIGFSGSYTLEFTANTGSAADIPSALFDDSVRDLAVLRSTLRSFGLNERAVPDNFNASKGAGPNLN